MRTTLILAATMLMIGGGSALHVIQAQKSDSKQTDIKRTELQRHDLSIPGREVVQVRVDFPPARRFPHTAILARRWSS